MFSVQPKTQELVEGYGVFITQQQLDEAEGQSCGVPTRLLRNLLMVFFTPKVLGTSSCLGTRKFPALNQEIVGACFSKQRIIIVLTFTFILLQSMFRLSTQCQELYLSTPPMTNAALITGERKNEVIKTKKQTNKKNTHAHMHKQTTIVYHCVWYYIIIVYDNNNYY